MVARNPLVVVDGTVKELSGGDTTPGMLPGGGTAGQVLTKTGGAAYAAAWADPAGGGPGGGLTEAQASAIARRAAILYAVR
ncbi:hypothetical protein QO001_000850 [Methylobacterium brachiatum]|jgi:hypothetical protein|uniref:Uncharacterized protein n=1 Tax=Methylobacterium brachiatum TaxID=269660 RepID=A0AAJ1TIX9_9HYPH|nr:hypothetical protein [Methylobacterium brachiatum]MCB4803505.1 hypothetical protein [Methylobacterium brachiatum]MDQ0541942.1 hypothetical protein [Methylobacterium brachiatum]